MVVGLFVLGDLMVFVSVGTDGIDGFMDVVGVIVDLVLVAWVLRLWLLFFDMYFIDNNVYVYFDWFGDLIWVGLIGTNVGDL